MLEIGLRVVRGGDWKWNDQDGGEGHAGTVVEIGKPVCGAGSSSGASNSSPHAANKTPDKTVIVQWDHGSKSNYRVGYQDAYDLFIFDNAATGVRHSNIICDGCKSHGIVGMRWKCSQCFDYDLCTQCYMSDVHDIKHAFQRLLTPNSAGVQLTTRENCTKIALKGIFIGAKVKRGPDWEWGNQDGGQGKTGRVIDIRGWDNESRSVATVTWSSGNTNVYRLGYKGCVDLCYVEESTCGTYYKEHLPLLGQYLPTVVAPSNDNAALSTLNGSNPCNAAFVVGDRVKVVVDVETLRTMQAGHGGWNPRMAEYIGKIGTVHRITDKGDIRVQYEGFHKWTFHPGALTIVKCKEHFALGDMVRVKLDADAVKHYQRGHGEWIDVMKPALGKTGKVIKIYGDGDLRVQIDGHTWIFNPLSVTLIPADFESKSATGGTDPITRGTANEHPEVEKVLREAARGNAGIPAVKEFLRKYPGRVDARGGPDGGRKTCLQVAAHQGQRELCVLLLNAGASLFAVDEDGDTPLHYAAFGNQPEIMELLLARGAAIDAVNNGKCSALHVAVNKQHLDCVKALIRHNCSVNLQDSYGDTSLHDAIGKEAVAIIDALCHCERIDFTLRNKRGFNVLHHAALKGNAHAMKVLVQRACQLIDVKKEDGFAALHLAALNGHREVAILLITATGGRARIEFRNNRKQTPLHLAASQFQWSVVELLVVNYGADISSTDEDGDTALHFAIAKCQCQANSVTVPSCRDAPLLHAIHQSLMQQGVRTELTLACFLMSVDSSGLMFEQAKNSKGLTPQDLLLADATLAPFVNVVKSYRQQSHGSSNRPVSDNDSSEPPIYQIETAPSQPTSADNEMSIRSSTHAPSADCNTCQRRSGAPNPVNQENQLGPGESGGSINCAHCGCSFGKPTAVLQNSHLNREESEDEVEREKAKNAYPDKNKDDKTVKDKDLERLRYLETRIADLEEANMCSICMERRRNVAFLCGHGACEHCAAPLKTCHMCRQAITKKINLY
ncbi:E3 ubiquitin-protein ligase MIB2 [Copidosoma floridanum]|uniref:E3 ubiquitin-protein ligase MIB2 n=1 Tax=Copidosoma floridanum TaxID=29053 RepID=UPI0006C9DB9A|nr:E3 ubiquitin-protein ligase MIB2 [Copidosoma floridanum]